MKKLLSAIRSDAPAHGSIPFWSWNDRLEESELRRQIQHMKSLGMKGFFMHARGGLETPYMSEEWFDSIRTSIDEAKKSGMEAWCYDENGWPSGFAGGELLKDPQNQACGLLCEEQDAFPTGEDILGVYRIRSGRCVRIFSDDGKGSYTVIRRKRDFSYVDTMNPKVTEQFLRLTHERYEREIGKEDFGKAMPGFFTDEPQYFRYGTPWSDCFLTTFSKRFGYDVLDMLPALFTDCTGGEEFRYDYHVLCHESFYFGFMKPLHDWCLQHGVKLTGHGIEEWGLGGQMMCCGGVMPFYLFEDMPGIDYLGRAVKDVSGARQLGSVCAQTGKKLALTETFACCGWDVTPNELKRITELQFAGGVNLICEHLYPYSERGQRKRDFPNHYSEHNPWNRDFSHFETYFQNLGSALSQGAEDVSTLVIHPIRSAYLHYRHTLNRVGTSVATDNGTCIGTLEKHYGETVKWLSDHQVSYHFGDETVMKLLHAHAEGNILTVGECKYDTVILPYCETIDSYTADLLEKYVSKGGKLLILGDAPTRVDGKKADLSFLVSTVTEQDLLEQKDVELSCRGKNVPIELHQRKIAEGKLIFLANPSGNIYRDVELTVKNCKGLCRILPETLEVRPIRGKRNADGSTTAFLTFGDSESYLLAETEEKMLPLSAEKAVATFCPSTGYTFAELPENMLTLDRAQVSLDGGKNFTEERPIERIRDELLKMRFCGDAALRFCFFVESVPEQLLLTVEPINGIAIFVNGKEIQPGKEHRIDRSFRCADIGKETEIGKNTVEFRFPYRQRDEVYRVLFGGGNEALRNCLVFDTEVEACYLFGHFEVRADKMTEVDDRLRSAEGPFTLTEQKKTLDVTDLAASGYPFFAGEMKWTAEFDHQKGDPTDLKLDGRFAVCRCSINGKTLPFRLFESCYDLSDYLHEGKNKLELTVCYSNRNLLGPHHNVDFEPIFVTPRTFSFEREWENGTCEKFRDRYSLIRFGIGF